MTLIDAGGRGTASPVDQHRHLQAAGAQRDRPLYCQRRRAGKAGGYAIQGRAAGLIRSIQGSHSAIMGLPLYETRTLLEAAGYPLDRRDFE
ncbi:Maf family protein [Sphingobium yanoikuyae]|uniref:Maf family protein n=1 Tax=Sphingobium yanoikuyae TaxID=13690 RepID=UPI00345EDED5